jgi:DNA replication protein DnaC
LFQLLNHRFSAQLPTVVNISAGTSLEELEERWRTRLTDPSLSQIFLLEEKPPVLDYVSGLELINSMTFDNFDFKRVNLPLEQRESLERAFRQAYSFAESPDGWLVFLGENGCGKTHLAAAIRNYQLRRGKPVSFQIVPDLLDHLRSAFNPESKISYDKTFEEVKSAPLLILDDFVEHSSTPWAQEKLYQLINYRYNARLPTIITMPGFEENLEEEIEPRISSRMIDPQISHIVEITAPDYRADHQVAEKIKSAPRRSRRG